MKRFFPLIAVGVILLVADQVTKQLVLNMTDDLPLTVTPFFNLVLVWNTGVSFGILNQGHDWAPLVLSVLSLAVCGGLGAWMVRVVDQSRALSMALAVTIAGAVGNVIDRLRFGAVVDFLDVHAASFHWPAFNIGDSCIVLGVIYIMIDGLFLEPRRQSLDKEAS